MTTEVISYSAFCTDRIFVCTLKVKFIKYIISICLIALLIGCDKSPRPKSGVTNPKWQVSDPSIVILSSDSLYRFKAKLAISEIETHRESLVVSNFDYLKILSVINYNPALNLNELPRCVELIVDSSEYRIDTLKVPNIWGVCQYTLQADTSYQFQFFLNVGNEFKEQIDMRCKTYKFYCHTNKTIYEYYSKQKYAIKSLLISDNASNFLLKKAKGRGTMLIKLDSLQAIIDNRN